MRWLGHWREPMRAAGAALARLGRSARGAGRDGWRGAAADTRAGDTRAGDPRAGDTTCRRPADPGARDGRALPQALRRVRRRALPDRRGLRGRRPAQARPDGAARAGRDPAGARRGERAAGGDRGALARRRGSRKRGRRGRRPPGRAPAGGRRGGAGVRRGVRAGPRRLQGLLHRQRPQAAAQRLADARGRAPRHGLPLPLQGRGLVPDQLPPRLLPGLLDPGRRLRAPAGRHLGAPLRARPPRPRRRPPVRQALLHRPAGPGHDPGAPGVLGGRGRALRRDPHGDAGRGLHRRDAPATASPRRSPSTSRCRWRRWTGASTWSRWRTRSSTASRARSRSRCRRRAWARPGPGTSARR